MTTTQTVVFVAMVFGAVMLLSLAVIIPTVGSSAQANRKMRQRIKDTLNLHDKDNQTLKRDGYNPDAGSRETSWRSPRLQKLDLTIYQAGMNTTAEKLLINSAITAMVFFIVAKLFIGNLFVAIGIGAITLAIPFFRVSAKRKQRLNRFEEQLPEALDVMARALKAGHPFNETLNFVAEEMDAPIGQEFSRVFSDINFGVPSRVAFHSLMERVPSVSLHTLITAVLIQQESGGALAEILEKVALVIRGRFKLQRKLRTLSAEGRMSAWVLSLIPFVLAGMLMVVSPNYLTALIHDDAGRKLIAIAFGLLCIGVLWIKFIINIKV